MQTITSETQHEILKPNMIPEHEAENHDMQSINIIMLDINKYKINHQK